MKIEKPALSGTLESSDLLVKVEPNQGLEIVINSDVHKQFGHQIRHVVDQALQDLGVSDGLFIIEDRGALDCIIKARVQSAVQRSLENPTLNWSQVL